MDSLNIYFTAPEKVEIRKEAAPEPGPDHVRVRTRRSLISTGTECICYGHQFAPGTHWDNWVKYPFATGYSSVGVVESVGSQVKDIKAGDRVTAQYPHQALFVTHASAVTPVPDGVSDEDATWFAIANITQVGVRQAEHALGDAVVIVGAGILAQLVVQYVRLQGAREIIVVDPAAHRLKAATDHGATRTIDRTAEQAYEEIWAVTGGRGADVVYEITGNYSVLPSALRLARRFGTLLLLGDTGSPSEQRLTGDVVTRGVRIVGGHSNYAPPFANDYVYWTNANMSQLFFTYLQRGDMRVGDLITHRVKPADAAEVYAWLLRDRSQAMGVIFEWNE